MLLLFADIDTVSLQFSDTAQNILKVVLGFIIFGVALDMHWKDFLGVWKAPKAMLLGLFTQLFVFPFLTFIMILVAERIGQPFHPSIALGMLLVAACPGGNMSNFLTHLAKGNTALSVSMSAISTMLAAFTTPFNFAFWGSQLVSTAALITKVELSFLDMFTTVLILLALPMAIGLWLAHYRPQWAAWAKKPMRYFSIIFFAAIVIMAFAANFENFLIFIGSIALIVAIQNAIALSTGYGLASLMKADFADRKTIAIEVGIQNSGLGLILCFQYFSDLGGMALIAAWWGVWHIISGLGIAFYWSKEYGSRSQE